ncbi:hypothetical protein GCM10017744_102870 [Streptomyces antimycoticus]|uniref:Uncharacterized protein n=1 Tax=Streptomyces antimycoticus TaxID=68175 RepID=A0A4D4KJJ6_9ACTN|nr:hypothetical protein [Streptomyces antimycoticus]GDY49321.1 hypothetical protein SANT12839_102030 [Streptomyces antimycoticus]
MPVSVRVRRPDAAVAAILRSIGQRGRSTSFSFVCKPCAVSWAGAESDCWSCGRPASSKHAYNSSALQTLLAAVEVPGPARAEGRADR